MSETLSRGDALVAEYLDRVRAAATGLDPARREELIQDLREHIATARAELSPETEVGVRTILDRLGDPVAIVAEAEAGETLRAGAAAEAASVPVGPPPAPAAKTGGTGLKVLIVALAVVVLVPVAICVVGALGLLAFQTGTTSQQGPVIEEVPLPSTRPS
jgi:uncharacterized membrane protein